MTTNSGLIVVARSEWVERVESRLICPPFERDEPHLRMIVPEVPQAHRV